jgi:hypothetical protein
MQKSRRGRRLEFELLPLSLGLALGAFVTLTACGTASAPPAQEPGGSGASPSPAAPPMTSTPAPSAEPVAASAGPTPPSAPAAAATAPPAEDAVAELPRGSVVLHIGDSFADALGVPLGKRLKAAGLKSFLEFKTPSYIPTWASSPELAKYLARYKPDLVLITLGANELEIPDPAERIKPIERLVAGLGGRACVWITPPLWKKDTGVIDVIRQHAAPCRILDSDSVVHDLPRAPDKIHPSTKGRETWADAVFAWLGRTRDPTGSGPWSWRVARR